MHCAPNRSNFGTASEFTNAVRTVRPDVKRTRGADRALDVWGQFSALELPRLQAGMGRAIPAADGGIRAPPHKIGVRI